MIRAFAVFAQKSFRWLSALSTAETFLSVASKKLESSHLVKPCRVTEVSLGLLVKHICRRLIYIVFDVFNIFYNADPAHLREHINIPLYQFFFRRGEPRMTFANAGVRDNINLETANAEIINAEHSATAFDELTIEA